MEAIRQKLREDNRPAHSVPITKDMKRAQNLRNQIEDIRTQAEAARTKEEMAALDFQSKQVQSEYEDQLQKIRQMQTGISMDLGESQEYMLKTPVRAYKREIMDKTDGQEGKTEPQLKMEVDYNDLMNKLDDDWD